MASLSIEWKGGLAFASAGDGPALVMAGGTEPGLSPMQLLAYAVMGCMAMDVVYVLEKGRHQVAGLTVSFDGARAETHPHRYTAMNLHFEIVTTATTAAVERAIELSRAKYCSVWHSVRSDITLATTLSVRPVSQPADADPVG